MINRRAVAGIALSASALVAIVTHEGYKSEAYIPVPGDVPTIGYGSTSGVKLGDTTTPTVALARALTDLSKFESALKKCIKVPLHQYEFDAYASLVYNIGEGAFCRSTLVRKLNAGDYAGACEQILVWNKFKGAPLRGLTIRRQKEYQQCIGAEND